MRATRATLMTPARTSANRKRENPTTRRARVRMRDMVLPRRAELA